MTHTVADPIRDTAPTASIQRSCKFPSSTWDERLDVQAKLTVGRPSDRYEQEADRIAAQITAERPAPLTGPLPVKPLIQRQSEEEEEELIQPKRTGTGEGSGAAVHQAAEAVASGGHPLPAPERAYFEPRLGRDLGAVRLHDGAIAARAARAIGARAYTLGHNIAFAAGHYAPGTTEGRRLIAHELVHTAQQQMLRPMIQRDAAQDFAAGVTPADTSQAGQEVEHVDAIFIFAGGDYGRAARAHAQRFFPDHLLFRANSFEALFDQLYRIMQRSLAAGRNPHLRELVIISHGNAAGGLQIPLARGRGSPTFNLWSLSELQEDFRRDLHARYRSRRAAVVSEMIDDDTSVITRACEFGQSPEAVAALRNFFGGEAWVWAPRDYQGYEVLRIGGERLPTAEDAFDFLMQLDYLPPQLEPLPDEDKRTYIARVFGLHGSIPSQFFVVGREDYEALQRLIGEHRGRGTEAEEHKEREAVETPSAGEYWSVSHPSFLGRSDAELDALSLDELEAHGRALMQSYRPEIAYMIVRLRQAWERKGMQVIERCRGNPDPLCGLPPSDAFGGSDLDSVSRDAERFPGPVRDAFATETITPPSGAASTEFTEGPVAGADAIRSAPSPRGWAPASGGDTRRGGGGAPRGGTSPGSGGRPGGAARPGERAAAEDFSKSRGTRPAPPEPEPETVDIAEALENLPPNIDRELAQRILDRLPSAGWRLSDYLSATELGVNVATAPLTFVEAGAAGFALEAGGVVIAGILSLAAYVSAVAESAERWEMASRALGIRIGYERLGLQFSEESVPEHISAAALKERLTSDYRVISQIRYNVPHGGSRVVPDIETGIDAVAADANRTLQAADEALRTSLSRAGLTGERLEAAFRAGRPIVRARFLTEMIRNGLRATEARRRRIEEQRRR